MFRTLNLEPTQQGRQGFFSKVVVPSVTSNKGAHTTPHTPPGPTEEGEGRQAGKAGEGRSGGEGRGDPKATGGRLGEARTSFRYITTITHGAVSGRCPARPLGR